jgi:nicotinamide phosphoribosyltransferase
MCAGGEEDELGTFSRLLDLYPTGILSVVSDTWDFWKVITEILPALKDRILARDGKMVIRPDSSPKTPVEIICGDPEAPEGTPEHNGLIQELWDLFGGTVNSLGYKVLNPHIGAIYGDSITYQYARQILEGLQKKGFASSNVVMGIGSYTYQYNTRDTLGFAMKATGVGVEVDGEIVWKPIFKDPKTDNGTKKSARGFLAVVEGQDGDLKVVQRETPVEVEGDLLELVVSNGCFFKPITFSEARRTLESMVE